MLRMLKIKNLYQCLTSQQKCLKLRTDMKLQGASKCFYCNAEAISDCSDCHLVSFCADKQHQLIHKDGERKKCLPSDKRIVSSAFSCSKAKLNSLRVLSLVKVIKCASNGDPGCQDVYVFLRYNSC